MDSSISLLNNKKGLKYRFENVSLALKEVFSRPPYIITAVLVALALFTFDIGIINIGYYLSFHSIWLSFEVFFGTLNTIMLHSVIMLIVLSILSGILLSLIAYQVKYLSSINESAALGFGGLVLSILAPACATCGIGLVALLGLSGIASSLPFAGLSLEIIGAALLTVGVYSITQKIAVKACRPKMKIKERK